MNDNIKQALLEAGIDIEQGIVRVNNSEGLYVKLLGKFLNDENYKQFLGAMESGDEESARLHLHALKGLGANLSMNKLYMECVSAEDDLKNGGQPSNMLQIKARYQDIENAIQDIFAMQK